MCVGGTGKKSEAPHEIATYRLYPQRGTIHSRHPHRMRTHRVPDRQLHHQQTPDTVHRRQTAGESTRESRMGVMLSKLNQPHSTLANGEEASVGQAVTEPARSYYR